MSSRFLFDGLRAHLRARGMTYADVARALKISEATVKRIFATRNCTLDRLDAICRLAEVDMAELARSAPQSKLISRLTREQEEEIAADPALMLVAVCAVHQLRVEEVVSLYSLDEAQCVALLLRLERIGFLEVHENNRIRLSISRSFSFDPDGPIMRYVKSQAAEFFAHSFAAPGEFLRMINVRVSAEAGVALLRRLEQIAREYGEQHNADARLPLAERQPTSVLLAVRAWEPGLFKAQRRAA
jgi:DNA-binding Xre family transcriptional regulator